MRIWIAVVCCLALAGLAALIPREVAVAAGSYFPLLRAVALAAVFVDARRLRLSEYAAGLGNGDWIFWLMMIMWPVAAVPWYLTIRDGIHSGRTPRRIAAAYSAGERAV